MYTIKQENRGLCPYDDTRYLLADLPDYRPNPNTHAYGLRDLATEEHLVADQSEPGEKLIIQHSLDRFARSHARMTRRLELAGTMEMKQELPDGNAKGELHGDQLLMAKQVDAARHGYVIRMVDLIERIIARDKLERILSPPLECQRHSRRNAPGRFTCRSIAAISQSRRLIRLRCAGATSVDTTPSALEI